MRTRYHLLLICCLLASGLLSTACATGMNTSVSPAGNAGEQPSTGEVEGPMTIEGKIVEVMESWPLQLTVETESGRYHVALLEETTIQRGGTTVDPGDLSPDMQVRIEGQSSGPNAMTADAIEILSDD